METQTDHPQAGTVMPHVFDLAASSLPGGRTELAKILGVSLAAVGNWKLRGAVPIEHCAQIELATGGRVSRRDLRPTDWHRIWPELATPATQETVAQKALAHALDKAVDEFGPSRLAAALISEQKPAPALDGLALGAIST
jgi:DNA-binding transcriptional regulator YdaS (Cro superfamily)